MVGGLGYSGPLKFECEQVNFAPSAKKTINCLTPKAILGYVYKTLPISAILKRRSTHGTDKIFHRGTVSVRSGIPQEKSPSNCPVAYCILTVRCKWAVWSLAVKPMDLPWHSIKHWMSWFAKMAISLTSFMKAIDRPRFLIPQTCLHWNVDSVSTSRERSIC